MKKIQLLTCILLLSITLKTADQIRVGDPGATFDTTKFDPDYPEMREWVRAGVQGGIPILVGTPVKKTIDATK